MPQHIAIIMDGNGRWAKQHHLPKAAGHKAGANAAASVVKSCVKLGIKYLTLYAFSSENWLRSDEEVGSLMTLLRYYLQHEAKNLHKNNIKVSVIGNLDKLDSDIRISIDHVTNLTADNTAMNLILAISYGGREEIVRASLKVYDDIAQGKISITDLNEELFSRYIDTATVPDPDLVIRTSGEMRLSNFLIWQAAYAELYFTDIFWPDFTEEELLKAVDEYHKRDRRYGKSR